MVDPRDVRRATLALMLAALGAGRPAQAQNSGADAAIERHGERAAPDNHVATSAPVQLPARRAVTARRTATVTIDGRADEPAWSAANAQAGFWQREPAEGKPPLATEFRVLFDEHALYVAVRAFDPEPARIRGLLTRRDTDSSSDWIAVEIDSYRDRRTAFAFWVNPAGVQRDVLLFNDVEQDPGWDAVWESASHTDERGWSAELRIPYNQLRFPRATEQSWGLQVLRRVQRTQELSAWSPWPRTAASQDVSLFGELAGVRDIAPARRLELVPYAVGGGRLSDPAAGDPLRDGHDGIARIGLDLKYGIGPGFTLSGTINPDFGQVEADPSRVNLTGGELFLEEKRPFFLEGTDIFRFSLFQGEASAGEAVESLFYSRRLGAAPRTDVLEDGAHHNAPDATTIYGAAKLSGKTADGWSFGVLETVTGQESAEVVPVDDSAATKRVILEPLTNYAVARVRKDLREGRTTVGAALTAVNRSLEGTKLDLHDAAYTGGLEATHRFWDETWSADLRLAGSYVHGSPAAIDATQTSSVHYLQRPDGNSLGYDPTRTSLTGAAMLWSIGKTAGGNWRLQTGAESQTAGLELNDLGFQWQSDYYTQWGWLQFRDDEPGDYLRAWRLNFNGWTTWNTAGERITTGGDTSSTLELAGYWELGGGLAFDTNHLDQRALRGGPMLRASPEYKAWLNLTTDTRAAVKGTIAATTAWSPDSKSRSGSIEPQLDIQARSNLELSIGASLFGQTDDKQYVDEVRDAMDAPHYVMARLHQVTAALTLRGSYTFSPRMSLQLYAQPFIGTGRYSAYKEVLAPRAARYRDRYLAFAPDQITDLDGVRSVDRDGDGVQDFAFELADFNVRELHSNLVFRWEYRPGSALFIIWSHGRISEPARADGRFSLRHDLDELGKARGEHVILAKLNYWIGL